MRFDRQRTNPIAFTTTHGIVINLQSVLRIENSELIKLVTQLFQEQGQFQEI
jgi:hypothetical protein